MKQLSVLVVLIAVTGATVAFRTLSYHPLEAARRPEQPALVERTSGLDRRGVAQRPLPEGAALPFVPASTTDGKESEDLVFARRAAEAGNQLLDKARRQPDNRRLLGQAAAHYRASLTHEPDAGKAGSLFADVRRKLAEVEALLARPAKPAAPAAAPLHSPRAEAEPATPVAPRAPIVAAPVTTKAEESRMVGPDGVTIERIRR
jgi:hypothetical protein